MWPFNKKINVDSFDGIILDENYTLPLSMDNEEYRKGMSLIREILSNWIKQDFRSMEEMNQSSKLNSLVHAFRNTDLKLLPYPVQLEQLEVSLEDTSVSFSGSRFFDAVVLIHSQVPIEVIETFKGKFLHGMLYGLPREINGTLLPSKDNWTTLLAKHPWVPFIQIVQQIFEEEIAPNATSSH